MTNSTGPEALQRYIRGESIKNLFINIVINAAIAWWLLKDVAAISAWGEKGYGPDLIITAFLLSAIISGIFIALHRRKRNSGIFAGLPAQTSGLAARLPFNPWLAALALGLIGVVCAVPPLLAVFALLDIQTLETSHYALVKGVWAGILAALLVPQAIRHGLRDNPAT